MPNNRIIACASATYYTDCEDLISIFFLVRGTHIFLKKNCSVFKLLHRN